jgi:hypothetical protein
MMDYRSRVINNGDTASTRAQRPFPIFARRLTKGFVEKPNPLKQFPRHNDVRRHE